MTGHVRTAFRALLVGCLRSSVGATRAQFHIKLWFTPCGAFGVIRVYAPVIGCRVRSRPVEGAHRIVQIPNAGAKLTLRCGSQVSA